MFRLDPAGEGTVRLIGRLDGAEAERALATFATLQGSIVADCSELDYISSAGIGAFLKVQKRLHTSGQGLRLVHPRPRVRDIFHYAGLEHVFQME